MGVRLAFRICGSFTESATPANPPLATGKALRISYYTRRPIAGGGFVGVADSDKRNAPAFRKCFSALSVNKFIRIRQTHFPFVNKPA
nr:hypothetical protein Iba_chr03dCG7930 [Ipomoea batatas]